MTPRRDNEPIRTCIGCRQRAAKRELLRVTLETDAAGASVVAPDPGGVALGRGAHLHPTLECLALAERRRAFGRAMRAEGAVSLELLRPHLSAPSVFDQELEQ